MVPNKNTVGTLGEVITDSSTGDKYKCVYICKTTTDKGVYYTYEWERVYEVSNNTVNIDNLITNNVSGTTLNLTTDRYQVTNLVDNTEIVLPNVSSYVEIHLFFTVTSDTSIIMPSGIKYQNVPNIITGKTYEFIFTYTNTSIGWTFGYIEYTE